MDDEQIIDLYWQRQEAAISESDRKYGTYCRTVADHILCSREDTEECVSDTWLHAWNAMPPQRPNFLRAFFAGLTRNLALDRFRASHAQKRGGGEAELILDELEECVAGSQDTEAAVLAKELEEAVNRFVKSLPEREGNIFIRRYFFAEPVKAIAARYRMTPNNATVILRRTREKLREALEKEGLL